MWIWTDVFVNEWNDKILFLICFLAQRRGDYDEKFVVIKKNIPILFSARVRAVAGSLS